MTNEEAAEGFNKLIRYYSEAASALRKYPIELARSTELARANKALKVELQATKEALNRAKVKITLMEKGLDLCPQCNGEGGMTWECGPHGEMDGEMCDICRGTGSIKKKSQS